MHALCVAAGEKVRFGQRHAGGGEKPGVDQRHEDICLIVPVLAFQRLLMVTALKFELRPDILHSPPAAAGESVPRLLGGDRRRRQSALYFEPLLQKFVVFPLKRSDVPVLFFVSHGFNSPCGC